MTIESKLIKSKIGLLLLAEQLGNVSQGYTDFLYFWIYSNAA